jgi:hypothetical protein
MRGSGSFREATQSFTNYRPLCISEWFLLRCQRLDHVCCSCNLASSISYYWGPVCGCWIYFISCHEKVIVLLGKLHYNLTNSQSTLKLKNTTLTTRLDISLLIFCYPGRDFQLLLRRLYRIIIIHRNTKHNCSHGGREIYLSRSHISVNIELSPTWRDKDNFEWILPNVRVKILILTNTWETYVEYIYPQCLCTILIRKRKFPC